jgi:hypothetical protein
VDAVFNVEFIEDAGHVRVLLFVLSQSSQINMPYEVPAFHPSETWRADLPPCPAQMNRYTAAMTFRLKPNRLQHIRAAAA